jgi:hypothetical protein
VWLLLLLSCDPPGTVPVAPSFAPAPPCPVGMIDLGPGQARMGSEEVGHGPAEIPLMDIAVERFCIDPYPFPGQAGDHYPVDGLAYHELPVWDALLRAYGRRLCTPEELLWASAAGPANLPYAVGQQRSMLCEPFDDWERMSPMGSWPACVSPWGLYDFNVMSSWATASLDIDLAREESHPKDYCVVGGTARDDTYYAPTNHGIHSHGLEDFPYFDDQLRVCADPGAWADPDAWQIFRQAAANQGSFGAALAWHRIYGPDPEIQDAWLAPPMPDPDPWW